MSIESIPESQPERERPKPSAEAIARGARLYRLLEEMPPVDPTTWDDPEKAIQPPIHSVAETKEVSTEI
jgi:hypothetical protein